jgi:hypothetical protein
MKILLLLIINAFSPTDSFLEKLEKAEIKHPKIVLAQAILETGWFSSDLCKQKNNYFGFWYNKQFKEFRDIEHCLQYYKTWQTKWYKGGDYYSFLECLYVGEKGDCKRYASDPKYIDKLQAIVNKL